MVKFNFHKEIIVPRKNLLIHICPENNCYTYLRCLILEWSVGYIALIAIGPDSGRLSAVVGLG